MGKWSWALKSGLKLAHEKIFTYTYYLTIQLDLKFELQEPYHLRRLLLKKIIYTKLCVDKRSLRIVYCIHKGRYHL